MSSANAVVMELLTRLGFAPTGSGVLAASWDSGRIALAAEAFPAPDGLPETTRFYGHYLYPRTLCTLRFDLPSRLDSFGQLKAILALQLKGAFADDTGGAAAPAWFGEGLGLTRLLPWVHGWSHPETEASCLVERDWMRVALRRLRTIIATADIADVISVSFDGSVVRLETPRELIAAPAKGEAWAVRRSARTLDLKHLPRRLMRESVEISASADALRISDHFYPLLSQGVVDTRGIRIECRCVAADAERALTALTQTRQRDRLNRRAHGAVDLLQCDCCRQRFLKRCVESIDPGNGAVAVESIYIPVTRSEARGLAALGRDSSAREPCGFELKRRHLKHIETKGVSTTLTWTDGPIDILTPA